MAANAEAHVYVGAAPWSAGEVGGLFRRNVAGGPWSQLTEGLDGVRHVQAVTIHPQDPRTVFIGTADGPWRSRDGGDSWERLAFPESDVQIWSIAVDPTRPVDALREEIASCLREADEGEGVLVLTDMFGGTPSNLSLSFHDETHVEVVTGLNLPMLVKLATLTEDRPLEELAATIREYGRRNISVASELLPDRKGRG